MRELYNPLPVRNNWESLPDESLCFQEVCLRHMAIGERRRVAIVACLRAMENYTDPNGIFAAYRQWSQGRY